MKIENCKLKIAFMGTPEIGALVLSDLINAGVNIDSIITRPDKAKGRSKDPVHSPVKKVAIDNNIPVYQPASKDELTEVVRKINPDLCIVAAYGMIIPNEALNIPKFGMINFHPSLLPKYRGPSPITEPILNGDQETGVTIIQVAEAMDAGDILDQETIPLKGNENINHLSEELAHLGAKIIIDLLPKIESGATKSVKQDESKATYMKMVKKEDGKIDWGNMTAEEVERMSRAYMPWPGTYTFWNNKKLDLFDINVESSKRVGPFSEKGPTLQLKPGEVAVDEGKILIGTKKDYIAPKLLKIEGKNKVTAEEFFRGYQDFPDSNLS